MVSNLTPETLAAQALGWVDPAAKAIVPPVHLSSTYVRDEDNQHRSGRGYIRADDPSFDQAEALITALEGGAASLLFAPGMAAATAVFLALKAGELPIEQPATFSLIINRKTAMLPEITISKELLVRPDEVIEKR